MEFFPRPEIERREPRPETSVLITVLVTVIKSEKIGILQPVCDRRDRDAFQSRSNKATSSSCLDGNYCRFYWGRETRPSTSSGERVATRSPDGAGRYAFLTGADAVRISSATGASANSSSRSGKSAAGVSFRGPDGVHFVICLSVVHRLTMVSRVERSVAG